MMSRPTYGGVIGNGTAWLGLVCWLQAAALPGGQALSPTMARLGPGGLSARTLAKVTDIVVVPHPLDYPEL